MNDLNLLEPDELLALARIDVEKERFDSALIKLKKASSSSPKNPEVVAELAKVYGRLSLPLRAKDALEQYLRLVPEALHERFQLGVTLFELGDRAEAQSLWREILARSSLYPPALFYSALASAQDNDLDRAWTLCKTVLDRIPTDNLYFGRAKDLMTRLEQDPLFRKAPVGSVIPVVGSITEH